jgi:hypothetical protein
MNAGPRRGGTARNRRHVGLLDTAIHARIFLKKSMAIATILVQSE